MSELERLAAEIKKAAEKDKGFLYRPIGKRFLKNAIQLNPEWPVLCQVLGTGKHRIEKMLSFHGIRKPRSRYYNWNERLLAAIKNYYERSNSIASQKASVVLRDEMVRRVNLLRVKEGFNPLSLNAFRCFAESNGLYWGWRTGAMKKDPVAIQDDIKWLRSISS